MPSTVETRADALCVRVLWGERRLATHLVRDEALALGDGSRPLEFRPTAAAFEVAFADGVSGELLRNGETPLSLSDAVHRGLATEVADGDGWRLEVGRQDVVRLKRGPLTVEAERVKAPPRAAARADDVLDYGFLNVLLVTFGLAAALLFQAGWSAVTEDDDSASGRELATMRRVLVKQAPPPPKLARTDDVKTPNETKAPRKETPAEGRPKSPKTPNQEARGAAPPNAVQLAKSLFGGPGVSGLIGQGGLGKELEGALGRVTAANGDGLGGLSLRGNGEGGPRDGLIGLGGIKRSGVAARGEFGKLCGGPGPCKQSQAPVLEVSDPIPCSTDDGAPCMDKELIRKVIASHRDQVRYCYEEALLTAPSLAGKVSLFFAVASSGDVAAASVTGGDLKSAKLSECLVSRVRTWHFPVPKRGLGYRVTYPFVFRGPKS